MDQFWADILYVCKFFGAKSLQKTCPYITKKSFRRKWLKKIGSVLFQLTFRMISCTKKLLKQKLFKTLINSEWTLGFSNVRPSKNSFENKCWMYVMCLHFWLVEKVIHPMYSKHWPYLLSSTIECDGSKISNHGSIMGYFFLFSIS